MMKEKYWMQLRMIEVDRQTTKGQWRRIARWLRECRNAVEQQIKSEGIAKAMHDMMIYGTGVCQT